MIPQANDEAADSPTKDERRQSRFDLPEGIRGARHTGEVRQGRRSQDGPEAR